MTITKRSDLLTALKNNSPPEGQLFLFYGERYLCKAAADLLQKSLLETTPGAVHNIDEAEVDSAQILSRLMSFSLLPGRQIYRVTDSRIFHTKEVFSEIWEKGAVANQSGKRKVALRHIRSLTSGAGIDISGTSTLTEIPATEWKKVFGFAKPQDDIRWADELLREISSEKPASAQKITERYIEAFEKGLPQNNSLILLAETVDKRQKLFTFLKKHGTIVDCSVAPGSNMAAQKEQKSVLNEMIKTTLAAFKKKIDPKAVEMFFDRVGFHPVAVVTETEKLAHYVGEKDLITSDDIEAMVARNREDALYELTDAFSRRDIAKTLTILSRLLEQGVHGLAILATMRNFIRKQLIFRTLQIGGPPGWRNGMSAKEFQNSYLPALKATGEWSEVLKGHPYALFIGFTKAAAYSSSGLKYWLSLLLDAEFRLKGSPLPQQLVLEELFFAMLKGSPKVHS